MNIYTSDLRNDQDMNHALGVCCTPCSLPQGDALFFGHDDIKVIVERKKLGDICQCILNGRYLYQAQSAKESGADVLILIVEGATRSNPDDGLLEIPVWLFDPKTMRRRLTWQPVRPTTTYSRFDQFLTELDYLAGIIVKRSSDVKETASIIKSLYSNFQTPPDQHNSLHQIFTQPTQHVELVRPNLVRRISKEISGIGWERSKAVSERFKSVHEMCDADVKQWQEIEGIGKKTAEKAVKELKGE